jgi:hypothetical protein
MQVLKIAQQDDADLILVHVERHPQHIAREPHQLLISHAGKAGNRGDADGNPGNRAGFPRRHLRLERF